MMTQWQEVDFGYVSYQGASGAAEAMGLSEYYIDESENHAGTWAIYTTEQVRRRFKGESVGDLKARYGVKSHKNVGDLVAIRKGGFWLYFRHDGNKFVNTGSTLRLNRTIGS